MRNETQFSCARLSVGRRTSRPESDQSAAGTAASRPVTWSRVVTTQASTNRFLRVDAEVADRRLVEVERARSVHPPAAPGRDRQLARGRLGDVERRGDAVSEI